MKYCPSPTCSYAEKYRRPLEYRDDVVVCAECGATLTTEAPRVVAAGVSSTPTTDQAAVGGDTMVRLGVTLVAALLIGIGRRVPIFGLQTSVVGGSPSGVDPAATFSLLAFGLAPFISGFLVVEFAALLIPSLRLRRVGGLRERAPLQAAAIAVGVVLLLVQILAIVRFTSSLDSGFVTFPPAGSIWAQYLASHLALLALVYWVNRRGLMNGFALVVLVEAATEFLSLSGKLQTMLVEGAMAAGPLLLLVAVFAIAVGVVAKLSRSSRPSGELGPTCVPFPISGLAPWSVAMSLIALPATLANFVPAASELARGLQNSVWVYSGVTSFLTIDATLIFGFLFFRPYAVGRLWARWVKGIDETGVVVRARALLPRAMVLATLLLVTAPLARTFLQMSGAMALGGAVIAQLVAGAFVVLDLLEEWSCRRRMGTLVSIRPIHRMAEVEPVTYVLRQAGVPFFARSFAFRTSLQFFGPYVPIEILVPSGRADEARRLLDGA